MKSLFLFIGRLVPAIVFIFSGFVKAIDPVGGAVKFEDYFTAFHMAWLSPIALPLSIALAALEFTVGFYLLFNLYLRRVATIALAMMGAFTLLTFYIAIFNPVSDCGCFGDALKLTNWQTFGKNVLIITFTYIVFHYRAVYINPYPATRQFTVASLALIFIVVFGIYNYNNLPLMDFRPYSIGTNIPEQMSVPEGAEMPEYETLFILEKEGQQETFGVDNYPYDDTTWVYIDSETRVIKEGYVPPLQTFALMQPESGDNVVSEIIGREGALFLMISPQLGQIPQSSILPLAELAEKARQKNIPFYCLTSSGTAEMKAFDEANKTMFTYLQSDETTLKTIIRSNPGLMMLYDGTITAKWHYNNLPPAGIMNNPLSYSIDQQSNKQSKLLIWLNIFGLILIPVVIFNSRTTK
ncbi:MAG: DoxX family protein [Bacteroidales bacterium]|nr:DoxX family protein [Bacteroidales bacterium]